MCRLLGDDSRAGSLIDNIEIFAKVWRKLVPLHHAGELILVSVAVCQNALLSDKTLSEILRNAKNYS